MLLEDCNEEDIKSICVQIIYQHIVRHSHYIYIKYGEKIDIFDFKRLSKCININPIKCYLDREKFHLPNSPLNQRCFMFNFRVTLLPENLLLLKKKT